MSFQPKSNIISVRAGRDVLFELSLNKLFDSFSPGQNGRHFADDIFRFTFVNKKFCTLIKISLKFVPKGPLDNNQALD